MSVSSVVSHCKRMISVMAEIGYVRLNMRCVCSSSFTYRKSRETILGYFIVATVFEITRALYFVRFITSRIHCRTLTMLLIFNSFEGHFFAEMSEKSIKWDERPAQL